MYTPQYIVEHTCVKILVSELECQMSCKMTLMMKLLINTATYHMPQNRVSDIIVHVTLNTRNNVHLSRLLLWSTTLLTYRNNFGQCNFT
jgi:hypothetical protein